MKKKILLISDCAELANVIERDLSDKQSLNTVATSVLDNLEGKLSSGLLDTFNGLLLGFSEDMQGEIAKDIWDFTLGHYIHWTNCPSADTILMTCYSWIAEEQGFELVNI